MPTSVLSVAHHYFMAHGVGSFYWAYGLKYTKLVTWLQWRFIGVSLKKKLLRDLPSLLPCVKI